MGKSDLTKARFMKLGLESCRGSDEKQCEEKQFEDYPNDVDRSHSYCCCELDGSSRLQELCP